MNTEVKEQSPAVTLTRILPVEDLILLKEATIGLENTRVEVLKAEGQTYAALTTPRYDTGRKYLVRAMTKVPKGQILVSIRTNARNFGPIDREFKELKEAREEKKAKQNS